MTKQTDLRIIRTRQMIKEAFLELMDTVGFSKITVENVTKKAFISRNTFYLHYTDKYDLLDKLENEVLLGLQAIIRRMPFEEMKAGRLDVDKQRAVLRGIFTFAKENRHFMKLFMSENGDPAFLAKLGETIRNIMLDNNIEDKLKIPQRYMVAILVGVQTNIIREWLRSGMKETPEELAEIVMTVFNGLPANLFDPT